MRTREQAIEEVNKVLENAEEQAPTIDGGEPDPNFIIGFLCARLVQEMSDSEESGE